jgi:hypothetical protein
MKTALTHKRFWDIKDKEKNVTDNLHAVPLHALDDDCSVKHLQRCETCVAVKGDYWHENKTISFLFHTSWCTRHCPG